MQFLYAFLVHCHFQTWKTIPQEVTRSYLSKNFIDEKTDKILNFIRVYLHHEQSLLVYLFLAKK